MSEPFGQTIAAVYAAEGPTVDLGRGVHEGALAQDAVVQIPLRMMNRHGLVAGATGTGKTVTLQTLDEQLSAAGVSVFAADVKGDAKATTGKSGKLTFTPAPGKYSAVATKKGYAKATLKLKLLE